MDTFILLFLFILGVSIGSFLNVLIDRWITGESILGRSYCDYCKKQIPWYDLIPILSFVILKGKTRCCHKKISFYYPVVEAITGILFVLTWVYLPTGTTVLLKILYIAIISLLIVIFFSDLKYQIITDESQILLLIFTFLIYLMSKMSIEQIFVYLLSAIGVMLPILSLFLITKGKGMGFGDVKFALNMGFLLGFKKGLIALYVAFILGASVSLVLLLLQKKDWKSKIAFGPFLVLGVFIMMFFSKEVILFLEKIYKF